MDGVEYILLQVFILLLLAKILGSIFEKYRMPKLIGEIIAGVVFINIYFFFPAPFEDFLHFHDDIDFLHIMGEIGIIFLLFGVGLETQFSDLKKVGKVSSYIAILGLIVPFIGGLLFILLEDITFTMALLIGTALFGMSTAVSVECLKNLDAMETTEAKMIVSASVIDDILCLALLGIIVGVIDASDTITIIINATIVIVFVLMMFLFISRVRSLSARRRNLKQKIREFRKKHAPEAVTEDHKKDSKHMGEFSALGLAVVVCLGLAAFSATIGLAAIIGAFLAGMIFAEFRDTINIEHNFNVITYFMLPFFFIWVGMNVHLEMITVSVLTILAVMVVVAVITKYVAGYIGAKMGKLPKDSAHLVGVSMIPRGEVGIIVATIGLSSGVFGNDMYAVIILMALITSILTPPLVTHAFKKLQKNRAAAFEEAFKEHEDTG